jgi:hypothetical protein
MIALEIEERRRFAQHFLALDAVHVFLAREQSQPPDNDLFLLLGRLNANVPSDKSVH